MSITTETEDNLRAECAVGSSRPTILVLLPVYLPGWLAGGPIRSIANIVESLGNKFEFRVITSDRDINAQTPYEAVPVGRWVPVGKAKVLYLRPGLRSLWTIVGFIRRRGFDLLYVNGFFPRRFSMLPLFVWLLSVRPKSRMLLAPRGEFSPGALQIKRWRKAVYIWLSKRMRVYEKVLWHASTIYEAQDIFRTLGQNLSVHVAPPMLQDGRSVQLYHSLTSPVLLAPDIAQLPSSAETVRCVKRPGEIEIAFLSRISRKKNLDGALVMLRNLRGSVRFSIYGPTEDSQYWAKCCALIAALPSSVSVHYHGTVPNDHVPHILAQHHLLFFPTHGENFGHVIAEALGVGRPVLISDQTPWRDLAKFGAGWDIPLNQPDRFRSALQQCIDMDEGRFTALCTAARRYVENRFRKDEVLRQNEHLFRLALTRKPGESGGTVIQSEERT